MEGSLGSFSAPNPDRDKSHTHTNIHTRAFAPGNVVFCKSAAASHRSKLGKKELVAEFSPAVVLLGPVRSTPYMWWGGGVSWPRNHKTKTERRILRTYRVRSKGIIVQLRDRRASWDKNREYSCQIPVAIAGGHGILAGGHARFPRIVRSTPYIHTSFFVVLPKLEASGRPARVFGRGKGIGYSVSGELLLIAREKGKGGVVYVPR